MTDLWTSSPLPARVTAALAAAAAKPSGAYLFVGQGETIKSEAASMLASALLCPRSCGSCDVCRRIAAGLHPDVRMMEPEGYTYPVETIREAVAAAAQSPMEASGRVFILSEADLITERSQNTLLKALEEPGLSVTWILLGATLDPFLPTILSRCRIVEFPAVGDDTLGHMIATRHRLPESEIATVVRAARGDVDRALALAGSETHRDLRHLAIDCSTAADPSVAWAFGAAQRVDELVDRARSALEELQAESLSEFETHSGSGRGSQGLRKKLVDKHKREARRVESDTYITFLAWMADAFRDLAALSAGQGETSAVIAADRVADLVTASGRRSPAEWLRLAESAAAFRTAIRENANAHLMIEAMLLELVGMPEPVLTYNHLSHGRGSSGVEQRTRNA